MKNKVKFFYLTATVYSIIQAVIYSLFFYTGGPVDVMDLYIPSFIVEIIVLLGIEDLNLKYTEHLFGLLLGALTFTFIPFLFNALFLEAIANLFN